MASFDLTHIAALLASGEYGGTISACFMQIQAGNASLQLVSLLSEALHLMTRGLVARGEVHKADWLWNRALEISNRRNTYLIYQYAMYQLHTERLLQAISTLEHCLTLDNQYTLALESLENMKSLVVDRWHFRMLNDVPRNRAYRDALHIALQQHPEAIVLDIGGGTGLLSMYAVAAGASHVYCCEMSPYLCDIASKCIENNHITNITVIAKHSSDLIVGIDIPQRVDIIVTELVDSGLLGEHIVSTLQHAKEHYLKCDGLMIPHSADIYGLLISSPELACRQELLENNSNNALSTYLGPIAPNEKYTCESLRNVVHTPLTNKALLSSITFSTHVPTTSPVQWTIIENGIIDAIAYMYVLNLLPADMPQVCVQSDESVVSGWDCAIIYAAQAGGRLTVSRATNVAYDMHIALDTIEFSLKFPLLPDAAACDPIQLGDADVASMNDVNYTSTYLTTIDDALSRHESARDVIDVSCNWISFGTLSKHADRLRSLCCIAISEEAKELFDSIWRSRQFEHVNYQSTCDVTELSINDADKPIIVANIIESCGLLQQNGLKNIQFALHLFPTGIVLPSKISIVVSIVECSELYLQHRVSAENTLGVNVNEINRYGAVVLREINISAMQRGCSLRSLNEPAVAVSYELQDLRNLEPDDSTAYSNTSKLAVLSRGTIHAVCVWYELDVGSRVLNTGPSDEATHHWRQAAFLVSTPRCVEAGDDITCRIVIDTTCGIFCNLE